MSEEEKCRRFEDDLNDHIRAHVTAFFHEDFSKIVTCTLNVERVRKEKREKTGKEKSRLVRFATTTKEEIQGTTRFQSAYSSGYW